MQWLIDIVLEAVANVGYALQSWVQAQGYLTTGFVDRGDPGSSDFAIGDFTIDGAWHELDLSAIVPATAKAVSLSVRLRSTFIGKTVYFDTKAHVGGWNVSIALIRIAGVFHYKDFTVPIGSDGVLKYYFTAGGWNIVWVTVKGWWL